MQNDDNVSTSLIYLIIKKELQEEIQEIEIEIDKSQLSFQRNIGYGKILGIEKSLEILKKYFDAKR